MTIGELASLSGIPASTIRYWEAAGVLPKPARVSGQRRYGAEAVHRIAVLQLAQRCGFGLPEMRRLLHGFEFHVPASRRWMELAKAKRREVDEQIARLRVMRRLIDRVLECKCVDLLECGRLAASVK